MSLIGRPKKGFNVTEFNGQKRKRVSHTQKPFDSLDENMTQLWIEKAQSFLGKQGWSWDDFAYAELVYTTAIYLHHINKDGKRGLVRRPVVSRAPRS